MSVCECVWVWVSGSDSVLPTCSFLIKHAFHARVTLCKYNWVCQMFAVHVSDDRIYQNICSLIILK